MSHEHGLTESERERFHNLLKLAAESPFEGERSNALAAAERLAARRGLTLHEAAGAAAPRPARHAPERESDGQRAAAWAAFMMDRDIQADKMRRDVALRAARERGLDGKTQLEVSPQQRTWRGHSSKVRRGGYRFARILLAETQMPFSEIAGITGLDVYQVVGLKLKMRKPEPSPA